jgi:hypothetical protein
MNPQSHNPIPINKSARCRYRAPAGRQCRLLASNTHSGLCAQHHAEQQQKIAADISACLINRSENFQTAQGINYSLGNLYRLLAEDQISPRRAAVLAYISSLLLRSLPAIDADQEAGITGADSNTAPEENALQPILAEKALSS